MKRVSGGLILGALLTLAFAWSLLPAPRSREAPAERPPSRPSSEEAQAWHRTVGILQYLQTDYPAAISSGAPSERAEQVAFADEALRMAREELGPRASRLVAPLSSLRARVAGGADPSGVVRDCGALIDALVAAGGLTRSPSRAPDLARGRALFQGSCTACHGADGRAAVPIAAQLKPPPADLTSRPLMDGLTPYKVFNTLTFGVSGTAMAPFPSLSEDQRWDLAFYVFTLSEPPCAGVAPAVGLDELANSTDAELRSRYGGGAVGCVRRRPPEPSRQESLSLAKEGVALALKRAQGGDAKGARKALVDAYLNGVEPVEPLLRSRDPDLVSRLEDGFGRLRAQADLPGPRFAREADGLLALLDQAARSGSSALPRFWSVFWLALLVVVREGFEATIVVAALLAVLKKMQAEDNRRVVNVAWISALVAGALAYVFGRKALAGADRELLEGGTALFASAMLIYAALWLNARANIRRFMGELRERMQGALGRGSTLGLFTIAFMAVFRESLETAIFLEGLSIDSGKGAAWGALTGLLCMVAFTLFINRVGYRLPMKAMFTGSTALLYATAVVLVGKGVHSLQEVGLLPLHPIRMWTVDLIGLYPDAFSFLPQVALALAPLAVLWLRAPEESGTIPGAQGHNT